MFRHNISTESKSPPMHVVKAFYNQFKWCSYKEIRSLTIPALLIHGENDKLIHLEKAEKLANMLFDADLFVLSETGHQLMQENPDDIIDIFSEWIETLNEKFEKRLKNKGELLLFDSSRKNKKKNKNKNRNQINNGNDINNSSSNDNKNKNKNSNDNFDIVLYDSSNIIEDGNKSQRHHNDQFDISSIISSEEEDDIPLTMISDYSEYSDTEHDDSHHQYQYQYQYQTQSNKYSNSSSTGKKRGGEMSVSTTMLSEEDDDIPLSLISDSSEDSEDDENPLRYHQHTNSNNNIENKEQIQITRVVEREEIRTRSDSVLAA